MANVSKQISDREKISAAVIAALEHQGPDIASTVESALFPEGLPERLDVGALIAAFARLLEIRTASMREADIALASELADDAEPRDRRGEEGSNLRAMLADQRDLIRGTYGTAVLGQYGLEGDTPSDARKLLNHAATVEDLLRTETFSSPKPNRAPLDGTALAEELSGGIAALRTALEDVKREAREQELAREVRDTAVEAWQVGYQGVASIASGLFRVANRPRLAQRVRPTVRRAAGQIDDSVTAPAGEEPEAEPGPGAGDTPT